jgi:signal transduction histidine kinase
MLAAVSPVGFGALPDDAALLSTRADQLVHALTAALDDRPCPGPRALIEAWRDLCDRAISIDAISRAFDLLLEAGLVRCSAAESTAQARVRAFISQMRTELLYGARYSLAARAFEADAQILRSFRINLRLLTSRAESARDLNWLAETPASAGCVGLWRDSVPGSDLVIAGFYASGEGTTHELGESFRPHAFPPLELFAPAMAAHPLHMLLILPLRTTDRDWGAFAVLLSPNEIVSTKAEVGVWQWSTLLMAALERERLTQVAETLADLRGEMVATVSHEVRGPLTAIIGNAELLKARWDSVPREKVMQQLDAIIQSAARQSALAESLLLLSRLEGGRMQSILQPVSLRRAIVHACDEVRVSYAGQQIRLEGSPDLQVLADGNELIQILRNLVDNAAKYSPVNIPVDVSWFEESRRVVIEVRDHGSGVPELGRDRLFTRFGRIAGSSAWPGHSSTGLGLYLSRRLAESMGGQLNLEANGPEGATFRLCLQPLA